MIRDATAADVDPIAILGRRFWATSAAGELIPYRHETFKALVLSIIEGDRDGIVLVSDDGQFRGCLAMMVYPHPLNEDFLTAVELFWRAENGHGRRLMAEMHKRLRERGVQSVTATANESHDPERTGKLYERAGYRLIERLYMRVL